MARHHLNAPSDARARLGVDDLAQQLDCPVEAHIETSFSTNTGRWHRLAHVTGATELDEPVGWSDVDVRHTANRGSSDSPNVTISNSLDDHDSDTVECSARRPVQHDELACASLSRRQQQNRCKKQ